jgi:carbon storage regulator
MLVLTRRIGQQIVIAGNIRVVVCEIRGNHVHFGITAPSCVAIRRQELVSEFPKPVCGADSENLLDAVKESNMRFQKHQ